MSICVLKNVYAILVCRGDSSSFFLVYYIVFQIFFLEENARISICEESVVFIEQMKIGANAQQYAINLSHTQSVKVMLKPLVIRFNLCVCVCAHT